MILGGLLCFKIPLEIRPATAFWFCRLQYPGELLSSIAWGDIKSLFPALRAELYLRLCKKSFAAYGGRIFF
jgi:hypothetical protein